MKKSKATNGTAVAVAPQDNTPMQIVYLPLAKIKPDPNQPRKVFDPEKLDELAESIRAIGIQQPLQVQLVPAKYKIIEPDLECDQWRVINLATKEEEFRGPQENNAYLWAGDANLKDGYQIIFGERRWRAAAMAGLDNVPCIVREVTDADRFKHQWIENTQRENVSALEEAEALAAQITKRKAVTPEFSPEDLAKELGIGRGTVYNRLTLTRLFPAVREALTSGKITSSVAVSIARVPTEKAQEKLLGEITEVFEKYGEVKSARDVEEMIEDDYVKQLSDAPFDLKAEFEDTTSKVEGEHDWQKTDLVSGVDSNYQCSKCFLKAVRKGVSWPPETDEQAKTCRVRAFAKLPTCKACPHRTGNMTDLFPDLAKRPNVCTQPECFAAKCKAHWLARADEETKAGTKVMTPKEFKAVKASYVAADKPVDGYYGDTWDKALGKKAPEPVLVATAEGLQKFYPKEDAIEAAKAKGTKFRKTESEADRLKEQIKEQEGVKLRKARYELAESLVHRAATGLMKLKEADAWALLVKHNEDNTYHNFTRALLKEVKGDRARHLANALGEQLMSVTDWRFGNWDKEALALWKQFGVDLEAEEKKATATQEAALPLAKASAKQKELLTVKARKPKKKGKK